MEKEEVGFVLYRLDKAHDHFFGNLRNVQEKEHPGIDA
jgi:hypothetical protein